MLQREAKPDDVHSAQQSGLKGPRIPEPTALFLSLGAQFLIAWVQNNELLSYKKIPKKHTKKVNAELSSI